MTPNEKEVVSMHKAMAHHPGDDVAVAVAPIVAGEEVVVVYVDGEESSASARWPRFPTATRWRCRRWPPARR